MTRAAFAALVYHAETRSSTDTQPPVLTTLSAILLRAEYASKISWRAIKWRSKGSCYLPAGALAGAAVVVGAAVAFFALCAEVLTAFGAAMAWCFALVLVVLATAVTGALVSGVAAFGASAANAEIAKKPAIRVASILDIAVSFFEISAHAHVSFNGGRRPLMTAACKRL
jgi:hypothetical protein